MLDFLLVSTRSQKKNVIEIYPKFIIKKSNDLMIRGSDFYAIWDEENHIWSTDEETALKLIDKELDNYKIKHEHEFEGLVKVLHMWDSDSGMIDRWHKYCQKQCRDNFHMLDEKIIFANDDVKKNDYSSKNVEYELKEGDISAYKELMTTLYSEEELAKIEWAIGSIVTGDSKKIQKFLVLYGSAGTGKSTVLNIVQQLFDGYYSVFDARALGASNNSFALEAFKSNPLVSIQHDGDLSHIEDNTRLNSLVSHELMTVNEKFKSTYSNRFKSMLWMGTNKPVKITDAKSGLLRRLIDVTPTGKKVEFKDYIRLTKQIGFELGAIAYHCKEFYLDNPERYDDYIPTSMLGASNDFYNFMLDNYQIFTQEDYITLKQAWEMYKTYCEEARVLYPFSQRVFKEEMKSYFWDFEERKTLDNGERGRNVYSNFRHDKFEEVKNIAKKKDSDKIIFKKQESVFDLRMVDQPAQYASDSGTPITYWSKVNTTLGDLDTSKLHYVKVPENHIVIDFDIPDENGEKDFKANLKAASEWPPTYAELSKSGAGIHLHYIYDGDASKLKNIYDDHIEIKVFNGNSSLRRLLTKCNDLPIATISSGLPLKGEKVINFDKLQNEKQVRTLIQKNLKKEYHPGTKPSIDFIKKILDDAYESGIDYNVEDMRGVIFAFAAASSHQADYCTKLVGKMHFKSEEKEKEEEIVEVEKPIIFYDVEVFPNLFLVNWKEQGEGKPVSRMINPTSTEIEELISNRLIGFNCRRYDNHIMYARLLGYNNEQLFNLSQRIIEGDKNAFFGEAYDLSYTDVFDFSSVKQSLKKFEIELGIHHQELGLPWDKPVPEHLWTKVAEYCDNDVIATEAVFNARQGDFTARQILADVAGMNVNSTTNSLTTRIIFGKERHPGLVYTDLATGKQTDGNTSYPAFKGYEYTQIEGDKKYHNIYKGVDVGFGGYVYAEPGMYGNVALLDVASLHPHSIIAMNCFGEYTKNFNDIVQARIAIKHKEFSKAKKMLGGKLTKYLDDESKAADLAQALKIAINSVYGLTSATFDNPFRDIRNKNNIVALRGALFMVDLAEEVRKRGYIVAHIKTDSIKIPDADKDIIDFCMKFANEYGYQFEHEATYEKMCLVNDAVYIAKYKDQEDCMKKYGYIPGDNAKHGNEWTATGAQFQIPYVFKTLFSKEPLTFEDFCETKSVTTALYLGNPEDDNPENYQFIGKVGNFCPIKKAEGGKVLYREKDGKYYSATGAKGWYWMESEVVKELNKEDAIDKLYYEKLADEAIDTIKQYGDYEWFVSDELYSDPPFVGGRLNGKQM